MAGEVLNMSILTINKHWCKLKDLCFKNRHKTIYSPLAVIEKKDFSNKESSIIFVEKELE